MKLAVSILGIKDDVHEKIKILNNSDADYLHIDVMDGNFVSNKTDNFEKIVDNLKYNTKKLDVHLMVDNVREYINRYKELNPEYITFHYEVNEDISSIIDLLKEHNIKVGISIKPSTDPLLLLPYLDKIDLVLIMTVEPGKGGQKFMKDVIYKIDDLIDIRKKGHLNFKIEVDGGINDETIKFVKDVDMAVVGSFITGSNRYNQRIKIIKEKMHEGKI